MKLLVILFLLFLSPIIICAQILDVPVAIIRLHTTVNISKRKFQSQIDLIEQQLNRNLTNNDIRQLLEAEINAELIGQDASHKNIRATEEEIEAAIDRQQASAAPNATRLQFQRAIRSQLNVEWAEYRQQLSERLVQEKYILSQNQNIFSSIPSPTQEEVAEFYEENATSFTNPAMIRFDHIFIDTRNISDDARAERRQKIDDLNRQLQSGQSSFDELLRNSLDDPNYNGTDFGYLRRQDQQADTLLGEDFIDSVFLIDLDAVADRVLTSNLGYHLVRITDRRSPKLLSLEDPVLPGQNVTVRDQIRNLLIASKQQELFSQVLNTTVENLREQAEIRILEENIDFR